MEERLKLARLDAALRQRRECQDPPDLYRNVKCEVCWSNIHLYEGKPQGIICSTCLEPTGEGACTRMMPLAITRSTMNEHGRKCY